MKRFLKFLLYLTLVAVGLIALFFNLDEIERKLDAWFYEPPNALEGISVGMHERNVAFKLGGCSEPNIFEEWFHNISPKWESYELDNGRYCNYLSALVSVRYSPKNVVTHVFAEARHTPFSTPKQMKDTLGKEDILAISADFQKRRYTYLELGVTYEFERNDFEGVMIGKVKYRQLDGEYFVNGVQFCPSPNCPYDEEGKIKPEFKDKDYRYLLSLPADSFNGLW